jgi:AcrR family transcriptional regulator
VAAKPSTTQGRKPAAASTRVRDARPGSAAQARARRKPATAYHHGDLERALVDAALSAIAEHGVERLTLRDLARRLGVSPGAPYRHFADKDALVRAVAGEVAARYQAELVRAMSEALPDTLSQFRAAGIAAVRFAVQHPAHFRVAYMHGVDHADGRVAERAATNRDALAAAQAAGEIAALPLDDILLTAECAIYGLSRLIVDGQLPGGLVTPARADAMAIAVTEVLGCGFVPRAPVELAAVRTRLARRR